MQFVTARKSTLYHQADWQVQPYPLSQIQNQAEETKWKFQKHFKKCIIAFKLKKDNMKDDSFQLQK